MSADPRAALDAALADRYAIERELGRGGMATVYLARDVRHKRPVALKVLHPELAAGLGPGRFEREIEFAARLQHPHILTVLDSGEIPVAGAPPLRRLAWGPTLRRKVSRVRVAPGVCHRYRHRARDWNVTRDRERPRYLPAGAWLWCSGR